ncbi:MAG TPA: CocE/NonD family hydrolase, partial [Gemmatimonadaceae bacterium]
MYRQIRLVTVATALIAAAPLAAQRGAPRDTLLVARRDSLERELERLAVIDRKLMIPMRDGTRIQFDVYRPKAAAKVPAIFVRTPYNMNYWDVALGAPADMSAQLEAVKRGYAYVGANERGHFYSEGNY